MAVGAGYLTKMYRAARIKTVTSDITAELTDLIEECRLDLQALGVIATKTTDETDTLMLGCVRSFVRWKMAGDLNEAEWNMHDYMTQRDEIRRRRDYMFFTITFTITSDGTTPIADAAVTFNGETIETGAAGTAVFYYVKPGVNQEYTVTATGHTAQAVDLDVTASATVTVTMVTV